MNENSIKLKGLIRATGAVRIEGPMDRVVTAICSDARRVTPGAAYVSVLGRGRDETEEVATAVERGAGVILSEERRFAQRTTWVQVKDASAALGLAAARFFERPDSRLKVIGVTGAYGKTTVAFLLKHILERAGVNCGLISSIQHEIGGRVLPAGRTIPDALEIQELLGRMVRGGCETAILETNWMGLERKSVDQIEFDAVVFRNHEEAGSWEGEPVFERYLEFFRRVRGQSSKRAEFAVNGDDVWGGRLERDCDLGACRTFGFSEWARVRGTTLGMGPDGSRFRVAADGEGGICELPFLGGHNVLNALGAAAAALGLGLPLEEIIEALSESPPVPGRLERIAEGQPYDVFVDSADTPPAFRRVLATLRESGRRRLLVVFGCEGRGAPGFRFEMGKIAAEHANHVLITSDNPGEEPPGLIASQVEAGACSVREGGIGVELDRRSAIEAVMGMAAPGDTVLIAGKGHERYQEFQFTVAPFDDREHAREVLENLGYGGAMRDGEGGGSAALMPLQVRAGRAGELECAVRGGG